MKKLNRNQKDKLFIAAATMLPVLNNPNQGETQEKTLVRAILALRDVFNAEGKS